ncbi:hypothetical protein [Brochothrix thermosphacta]|uniref:hypothetical protein n=1 Tax=Brochothrix thermosphacta TaxID=2756 RepID=UPI001F07EBB4|nr:hypothetical protein [Brochothrix thermosphacta]
MKMQFAEVRSVVEQAYISKQDAIVYFGYQNHQSVFQKLLKEFKEHVSFGKGYILSTYGLPILNIQLFEEFLRWRDENKYKRKAV